MDNDKFSQKKVFLFDLDGVIVDTENLYTDFWNNIGIKYLKDDDFGLKIKGQSLSYILDSNFWDKGLASQIKKEVDIFEASMSYPTIPGAVAFLKYLKEQKLKSAIVTSSNNNKMNSVYKVHPDFPTLVDRVITSEDFQNTKPDPECFIKGMELFDARPEDTVIFEDSFHGLSAAKSSGATVVGLATTNERDKIANLSDIVIDDFTNLEPISFLFL